MDPQIQITLPEERKVPEKIKVTENESNEPERITTTYTVNTKPKAVSEDKEAES